MEVVIWGKSLRLRSHRLYIIFAVFIALFTLEYKNSFAAQKPTFATDIKNHSIWEKIKGQAEQNQVHLGMLSYHISLADDGFEHNWKHKYVALIYDGFFLGTLINSRYQRSYLAGISRSFYQSQMRPQTRFSLGYSLGAITGYDKKSFDFAEKTPALPFFSLNASVHHKKVGVFFGWCAFVFYSTFSVTI